MYCYTARLPIPHVSGSHCKNAKNFEGILLFLYLVEILVNFTNKH